MHRNRLEALRLVQKRKVAPAKDRVTKVATQFGERTFGIAQMSKYLSAPDVTQLKKVAAGEKQLDKSLALKVAEAIKKWAISHEVTHFTHWFQPLTGLTAEKHDSFVSYDAKGKIIEKFSVGQLIQSEPDASSFPSGGTRTTFEARGYTAWDVSSPLFIVEDHGTKILCIPSVFVSYKGHALDTKTGLMRSLKILNHEAVAMLAELGDKKIKKVFTTIGCEQEYFLIDAAFANMRPDLISAGRTLVGSDMPKGQELEDHYFGSIPSRVLSYMADVESELYRLGIPAKTRHNEVAPSQFELAPIFEDANLAADHNMLTMEVLRRAALRHNFMCILHEKPFKGINGSGKHNNWSMSTDTGENLLEPGDTPSENLRFMAFLSCVLKAVHSCQVGLRAAIATHGNDHRLGANEAPPAIISVFLGATLSNVVDVISKGEKILGEKSGKGTINFGINQLPELPKDNTDRNRTSPFAFTGNKFEFRAVGSSQAISYPVTMINAAVAKTLKEFTAALVAAKKKEKNLQLAAFSVIQAFLKESKDIIFEGNGYSDEWRAEAKRRGLYNLQKTPEALAEFAKHANHKFLIESGVYTESELEAILEVQFERYAKHLNVEAQTMLTLARQLVLPAVYAHQRLLAQTLTAVSTAGVAESALKDSRKALDEALQRSNEISNGVEKLATCVLELERKGFGKDGASYAAFDLSVAMLALRESLDKAEKIVGDDFWPLPKYREMLFLR
jgi:glutamine synthetase